MEACYTNNRELLNTLEGDGFLPFTLQKYRVIQVSVTLARIDAVRIHPGEWVSVAVWNKVRMQAMLHTVKCGIPLMWFHDTCKLILSSYIQVSFGRET